MMEVSLGRGIVVAYIVATGTVVYVMEARPHAWHRSWWCTADPGHTACGTEGAPGYLCYACAGGVQVACLAGGMGGWVMGVGAHVAWCLITHVVGQPQHS